MTEEKACEVVKHFAKPYVDVSKITDGGLKVGDTKSKTCWRYDACSCR